jgi:hypothetical protein
MEGGTCYRTFKRQTRSKIHVRKIYYMYMWFEHYIKPITDNSIYLNS